MSKITKRNQAILKAREILSDLDQYMIVDTKTSGLGNRAEVIELCAMSLQGEVVLNYFFHPHQRLHQPRLEPHVAIAEHGLTPEVLQQKETSTWDRCGATIKQTFAGKVLLAYNASFNYKMIKKTATLYGFDNPIDEIFCIMGLRQRFTGTNNSKILEGEHTTQGVCHQILSILREIAAAELVEHPEDWEITNQDQLIEMCLELQEISAQRLAIEKREKIIKEKCGLYLKKMNLEQVPMNNGQQVERWDTIIKVKSQVPVEDLATKFKTTRINHGAINKLWREGKLDTRLFSYEETWSIKIKKQ